jgi:hypothetical protein
MYHRGSISLSKGKLLVPIPGRNAVSVEVEVFLNGTSVRSGASVQSDPPNINGIINNDEFDAIKQCAARAAG